MTTDQRIPCSYCKGAGFTGQGDLCGQCFGGYVGETTDTAESQAKAQLDSIIAMVQRLEHARECDFCGLASIKGPHTIDALNEYHDEDAARQAIHKSPLSVLVRSEWYNPSDRDCGALAEYEILLCTGGPAIRIRGDLVDGQPSTARLEYQNSTSWTQITLGADYDMQLSRLLTYAQQFYFGD